MEPKQTGDIIQLRGIYFYLLVPETSHWSAFRLTKSFKRNLRSRSTWPLPNIEVLHSPLVKRGVDYQTIVG